MANTYSQIYIQVVFAVQNRKSLISPDWETEFFKYITGIVTHKDQKLIAINGMPDHIHIFLSMKPDCLLSNLVQEIKKSSNHFIKEKGFTPYKFDWQDGYGAFSYGHSQIDDVVKYIFNQKEHHKKFSFKKEYLKLLELFQIPYKERYLFEFFEE
jgi:REP element-mobilizing transposase RayT